MASGTAQLKNETKVII